jgi:hypothetical protein
MHPPNVVVVVMDISVVNMVDMVEVLDMVVEVDMVVVVDIVCTLVRSGHTYTMTQ